MMSLVENLEGKILVASPALSAHSYFSRTVIYILRHSTEGAVGLIINQPLPKLGGSLLVKHEGETIPLKFTRAYAGGPVDMDKGFVLHLDKTIQFGSEPLIKLSFDVSLLKAVAKGTSAAKNSMFLFGYCGWSAGQLEEEIRNDDWLVANPDKKIIFEMANHTKWSAYLNTLSINPTHYVDCAGTC
jgi:putative transcriptional regulator